MGWTKRKNPQREAAVHQLIKQKYPNGLYNNPSVISNYAKMAARLLVEAKVPMGSYGGWELYRYYELDHPGGKVRDREDTDSYRLMKDGRLVRNTTRELTYTDNRFQAYDKGTEAYSPSETDLIQIDLFLEEKHIHGALESFLRNGGHYFQVSPNDPYVQQRIQQAQKAKEAERKRKQQVAAYKAVRFGKSVLFVIAWLLFAYFVYRFGKDLFYDRDNLLYEASRYIFFGSFVLGLLNFTQASRSYDTEGIFYFTLICAVILTFIYAGGIFQYGTFMESYFWIQFAILLVRFAVLIIVGQIAGRAVHKKFP